MTPESKTKSLIEQSRQLDPDCERSSSFIFLINKSLPERDKDNHGWKLHISVAVEDLEKAFELIAPILHDHFYRFKVIDINRYKFALKKNKDYGPSYGTFAVTDCGDSIQYKIQSGYGSCFVERLDKASLGLPSDKPLTTDSL
ncbi:TPA: hypothetical protein JA361_15145 [Legionella pneumophila]|nr:hypothetical protein [Legionella pneumophila]HAT8183523.1 hypothetical protein [Legionella pneumophila]